MFNIAVCLYYIVMTLFVVNENMGVSLANDVAYTLLNSDLVCSLMAAVFSTYRPCHFSYIKEVTQDVVTTSVLDPLCAYCVVHVGCSFYCMLKEMTFHIPILAGLITILLM